MAKDKTFFVNLRKEDTRMLKIKLTWIVDELERRILKSNDDAHSHIIRSISKPNRIGMSKSEVIHNIKRWYENPKLKIHMTLSFLKENNWEISKNIFIDYCKSQLRIKKPELFILSLTKKPYIREWINVEDQKRKSRDYGDVLNISNGSVILNEKYKDHIKKAWRRR